MNAIARMQTPHVAIAALEERSGPGATRLNIGLAIVALVVLMYYVMQVNMLAATAWQVKDARVRLGALTDEHSALVARVAELEDRAVLQTLARDSGFVPADAVVYLIEPSTVAAAQVH
jgi:hypothetical protein